MLQNVSTLQPAGVIHSQLLSEGKRLYWFFTYLDGKDRKARLEDGYHEGGYRSGWQVLSNSASALVAACLWNAAFAPNSFQARILNWLGFDVNSILRINHLETYSPESWCLLSGSINEGWSRMLIFASLGWVCFIPSPTWRLSIVAN